jgi:hypothetical protein
MAGKIIGRAYIRLNGETIDSQNGATLNPGGFTREAVNSDSGYAGYTEKHVNAEISCSVVVTDETDIVKLGAITEATVTFEAGNGAVYVIRRGTVAEPPEYNSGDGTASLKIIGSAAEKA